LLKLNEFNLTLIYSEFFIALFLDCRRARFMGILDLFIIFFNLHLYFLNRIKIKNIKTCPQAIDTMRKIIFLNKKILITFIIVYYYG